MELEESQRGWLLDIPDEEEEVGLVLDRLSELSHMQDLALMRHRATKTDTDPMLLDHVLHLLHGGVDVVTGKVEYYTESRDMATPSRPLSIQTNARVKTQDVLSCLELDEAF